MNIILYRFCAKIIDVLGFILTFLLINLVLDKLPLIILNLLVIGVYIIWFIYAPLKFNKTLGKKFLGLKITPPLTLGHVILREPFFYIMILVILATIIYPNSASIASYLLLASLILGGIMLVMFYFKKDIWNQLNHCSVVETK